MSHISAVPLTMMFFLVSSAFFYFSVHGCPPNEFHALFDFKSALNFTQGALESWKGHNCCAWDGVECYEIQDVRHVFKMDLGGIGLSSLSAEIPWSSLFELKHLNYLDLSGNEFHGEIPSQLGGLSSLYHLDLSDSSSLTSHNLSWLSKLSSLQYLSFKDVNVSDKNWGSTIGSLFRLKHLDLSRCSLPAHTIPSNLLNLSSLTFLNLGSNSFSNLPTWMFKLTSLTHLDLAYSNISESIPSSIGNLTSLEHLDLSKNALTCQIPLSLGFLNNLTFLNLASNHLSGSIPSSLGNLMSLKRLYLNDNQLCGLIPSSIGNLLALEELHLYNNKLQGNIPAKLGNLHELAYLSLFSNHLSGSLPLSITRLSSLIRLDVRGNRLNGSIPSAFMLPSSLVELDLSNNSMNGAVTEVFFQKSLKLQALHLSGSGLSINISSTWIPPFQLQILLLKDCKIDGPIPDWISTQLSLGWLDLSATKLSGDLPAWFWDIHLQGPFNHSPTSWQLMYLDLSKNELSGRLPVDIHMILPNATVFVLADNKFEGQIPTSIANLRNLIFLDMSSNCLTGSVPGALGNLTGLEGLHLQNNYLEGEIPMELGRLSHLVSLRIRKNSLQGVLPSSLRNLSSLQLLDVAENNLTGNIPHWLANFSSLHVLVMGSNNFTGLLPPDIGGMPSLRVLDLSSNFFAGTIPHSYFRFPSMKKIFADGQHLSFFPFPLIPLAQGLSDSIDLNVKGQERHYEYVYSNMVCFDLSNNRLSGPLSPEIDNLKGLMYLNLSMNSLSGPIPQSLGNLVQLESIDLSFNNFSGEIPYQIGNLTYLAHLNLSYNNLCGRIPLQGPQMLTFDELSYIGNPHLWGCPIERNRCRPAARVYAPAVGVEEKREEGFEFPWYWMCFGLAVGVGFSTVVAMLSLNLSWRVKYFELMDGLIEQIDKVIRKLKG